MGKFIDLTGNRYGRLTVVGVSHKDRRGAYHWHCQCACGNLKAIARSSLQRGLTTSCGCFAIESSKARATTHGMSGTLTYKVWSEMVNRATNPNHQNAKYYFNKGITVCDEWKSFENFHRDMGDKPEGLWLERINGKLPYCKENCKWETPSRQCSNRTMSTNTSGRIGVTFDSAKEKWRAHIVVDGKDIECGRFSDFDEACAAVEKAELELLGYSRSEYLLNE